MNRLAWIAIVALAGVTVFVAGDLLDPESVPVAQAVELTGTVPADRPPREGFFVVPPRVVDFRDDAAGPSDPSEAEDSPDDGSDDQDDDGRDEDVPDEGAADASPDDSPDDQDDEDDSVDDDD